MRRFQSVLVFSLVICPVWASPSTTSPTDTAVLEHLDAHIGWYRRVQALDRGSGEPSDLFFLENARSQSAQAVALAFQVAEALAALAAVEQAASQNGSTPAAPAGSGNPSRGLERIQERINDTEAELKTVNETLARAPAAKRDALRAQRDELKAELELATTQQEAMKKISTFVSSNDASKTRLAARIYQLKASMPEVFAPKTVKETPPPPAKPAEGLFSETAQVLAQIRASGEVEQALQASERLHLLAEQLQTPLRASLRATIQEGRTLAEEPPGTDRPSLDATRRNLEALTERFKLISAVTVPLREEVMLLDQAHGNLGEWRNSIQKEYRQVLRELVVRVATMVLAVVVLLVLSEVWRRATFRYVSDARRRRQFLILRRFVTGSVLLLVLVLGFISEFGSLATFAGFITAGVAVALQTVILSVAAYFLVMGRYGLRVGDRITVGGVTGDVVDIGMVRLYLMELAGAGVDVYPTGRVVVFSNSVLFQAGPLFKQIPGSEFTWHELTVALAPKANPAAAEKKILETINTVYADYRETMERQHGQVARTLDYQLTVPAPLGRLQFSDTGLECLVRYPVEIRRASEIDDRVTRAVKEAIDQSDELKSAVIGMPRIRSSIRS